jgi:hypothetical protein
MNKKKQAELSRESIASLKSAQGQISLATKTITNITLKLAGIFQGKCENKCNQCVRCTTRNSLKNPKGIDEVASIISSELAAISISLKSMEHPIDSIIKENAQFDIPVADFVSGLDEEDFKKYTNAYYASVQQSLEKFK